MQVTVTGNIGSFKGGQILKSDKTIAAYYRTVANEGSDNPTTLSDADILKIVASVAGDNEDAEMERTLLIEQAGNPEPEKLEATAEEAISATGNAMASRALALADELGKDEVFGVIVDENIEAAAKKKRGPVNMFLTLVRVFGDRIKDFPVPGSSAKDKDIGNKPYDKYTVSVTVAGKKVNRPGSFYSDVRDRTPRGKQLLEIIAACEKREGVSKGNPTVLADKNKAIDDLKTYREQLVKGVRMAIQWMAIEAAKTEKTLFVEPSLQWKDKDKGEIYPTNTPIILAKTTDRSPGEQLSVDQFLALDVAKAIKLGGTLENLMSTSTRGANNTDDEVTKIENVETADDVLAAFVIFLNDRTNLTKWRSYLEKKENEDALLSFGDLCIHCDGEWQGWAHVAYETVKDEKRKAKADAREKMLAEKAKGGVPATA